MPTSPFLLLPKAVTSRANRCEIVIAKPNSYEACNKGFLLDCGGDTLFVRSPVLHPELLNKFEKREYLLFILSSKEKEGYREVVEIHDHKETLYYSLRPTR